MQRPRIILAAHGCGDASLTNRLVRRLADRVASASGLDVRAAFNLGTPGFAAAAHDARSTPHVVVPLMLAEGYFLDLLRARLDAVSPGAPRHVLPPIGLWESVVGDVVERACAELTSGVPGARGLVVGHGTARNARSQATTIALADRITLASGAACTPVFLDDEPRLEDVELDGEVRVVVVPWLLGGGDHALVDIPMRLGLPPTPEVDAGEARNVAHGGVEFTLIPAVLHAPALAGHIVEAVRGVPAGAVP